jgi:peroxiredoxin
MAQLRLEFERFEERNAVIVAIGPEGAAGFAAYFRENDLPFIGLPDPAHSVLKLYGQEIKLFKMGRMPAQVLVDRNGMARFVHYGDSMSDIPANSEILALIDQLNAEQTTPNPN